jgi:hypothetical protein
LGHGMRKPTGDTFDQHHQWERPEESGGKLRANLHRYFGPKQRRVARRFPVLKRRTNSIRIATAPILPMWIELILCLRKNNVYIYW